jgi:protein PET100
MGGPNLEVFKFGLYLFVPVFTLLHFGDPDWYHNHVLPVGFGLSCPKCRLMHYRIYVIQYQEKLFPPREKTNQVIHSSPPIFSDR